MKTTKLYEVRRYTGVGESKSIGHRLYPRLRALKIVRFLKARKVEAYAAPYEVTKAYALGGRN